jgi:hypothetical protein
VLLLYSALFPVVSYALGHALNSTPLVHNATASISGRLLVVKNCLRGPSHLGTFWWQVRDSNLVVHTGYDGSAEPVEK